MTFKTATSSGAVKTAFREQMKDVFTCVPGHVLALENGGRNQRAQIQVGIQRVDVNGASFDLPPIINVPIQFVGDDYILEHEVLPLCEGLIHFSQRCIDGWKNTGGTANNPLGRFHDMQDAFFVPGVRSLPNVFPDFQNNGMRMRNKAGTQFAWLKNDGSIAVENALGHVRIAANGVVTINGVIFAVNGAVSSPVSVTAPLVVGTTNVTFGGKSGVAHVHSGVQPGSGNSGAPV